MGLYLISNQNNQYIHRDTMPNKPNTLQFSDIYINNNNHKLIKLIIEPKMFTEINDAQQFLQQLSNNLNNTNNTFTIISTDPMNANKYMTVLL